MPPFPPAARREPRLQLRQNSVILSITRDSTTYTTTIGLTPSTAPASNPTPAPAATQDTISAAPNPNTGTPTPVVVGAVLGSILGLLVLIALWYKCCIDNRSAAYVGNAYTSYDSDTNSYSDRSSHSGGVGTRGGGWDRRHRHRSSHGVRRPPRVQTRRRRRDMSERGYGRSDRSEMSWGSRDRRRRSSMMKRNGLVGWRLAGKVRTGDRYERGWPRDRRDDKSLADD